MESSSPSSLQPTPEEEEDDCDKKSCHPKENTNNGDTSSWMARNIIDYDDDYSSSLLLAALDLASLSASTTATAVAVPLKRRGNYRPIGAFAMRPSGARTGTTTATLELSHNGPALLDTVVSSMTSSSSSSSSTTAIANFATTTPTSQGILFRVPVADLVADHYYYNPTSGWNASPPPLQRDIEVAEIYTGMPILDVNPMVSTTSGDIITIPTNHHRSAETVSKPFSEQSDSFLRRLCGYRLCCRVSSVSPRNGAHYGSRFIVYALSCLLLVVVVMVAMVLAIDVIQDGDGGDA
jgi:hypothetical protein